MKKILLSLITLLLALSFAWAVPADPTPYEYKQPDGSIIVLQNHGDEYFHWTTDALGRVVEFCEDGYWRLFKGDFNAMATAAEKVHSEMDLAWSSHDNPWETNFGDRKVLCLLANFSDLAFTVSDPYTHFYNMLNQQGYDFNGANGSVRDYYIDNSLNRYRPEFDVFGPVTLSQTEEYYDSNGVYLAIQEAYDLLSSQINISDYDTNNDGKIDMVLFYFPGYNEAEGGPSTTIWPHRGHSSSEYCKLGGLSLWQYFCTSELRGSSGTNYAAIGTTCHEFAHSLGLPDFYDTDKSSSGGENTFTTETVDLMSGGNYNDNGRKPPYLNALERYMLGWMTDEEFPTLYMPGDYTLRPIKENKAYRLNTGNPNEYFILEDRVQDAKSDGRWGWDNSSGVYRGLYVYHVDQSNRIVYGGLTAREIWNSNKINAYGGHPCFRLIPAISNPGSNPQKYGYGNNTTSYNVTSCTPVDWDGNQIGVTLTNITRSGAAATFTATFTSGRIICGYVKDLDGTAISGAQISLTQSDGSFDGAPAVVDGSTVCTTDAQGYYSFELDSGASDYQIVRAWKEGYKPTAVNVTISTLVTNLDFVLLQPGQGPRADLIRYDENNDLGSLSLGTGTRAVGFKYTAAELSSMGAVGAQLETITFYMNAATGTTAYILADLGTTQTLRKEITSQYQKNQFVTIDVTADNIIIPSGKDLYIGVGFVDIPSGTYPFSYFGADSDTMGAYRVSNFLTSASWSASAFSGGSYPHYAVSATIRPVQDVTFSDFGVSYIKEENDVPTLVLAQGKSYKSTTWYLDGIEQENPPATTSLSSGTHTYLARILYHDGSTERVYYDVTKQ